MKKAKTIIVIGDMHIGCQFALAPVDCRLAGGGVYRPSITQQWILDRWTDFFDAWVPEITDGEPYSLVVNGDVVDARHHGATTQWTQDQEDMAQAALDLLHPRAGAAEQVYLVAGTEVHTGPAGEIERRIAESLGAVPAANGNPLHQQLRLTGEGGVVMDFQHHIGPTGSAAYEATALGKELVEIFANAGRLGLPAPDVVCRAHRHRPALVSLPTAKGHATLAVTAPWQLKTPHVFRGLGGRTQTPCVGGLAIRILPCGQHAVVPRVYYVPEPPPLEV